MGICIWAKGASVPATSKEAEASAKGAYSGPPPGRCTQEGSSSSATVARAKPSEPTPLDVRSVSIGGTTEPTPLGVRSVSIGVTTDRATDFSTAKSSGPKQLPPFLAKGSSYRATILGSQQAKPKSVVFSKPVEIKQIATKSQPLRPKILLPDTCLYYTWVNGRLTETSTRDFEGAVAIRPNLRVSRGLVLALDYHQVLDRSRTETAWAVQRVPRENFELIRKLKEDLGDRLIICVCSHIERSEKNLRDLIRCLHNTDGIQNLIEFVTITTQRTGALGKPGEPFDHKKRAHTALVHKIFSRPYAVFTAIRIAVYNFTFFTVSTAIQRFSTAKCTLFQGQILFSRPYLDSKANRFFEAIWPNGLGLLFRDQTAPQELSTLAAICQKRVPCMIIDDNAEVIAECSEKVQTVHLMLRRKPQALKAHKVRTFLEECESAVKAVFEDEVVE